MAVFERARAGSMAHAAREFRPSRYLPLYLAALAAGAGMAVAITLSVPGDSSSADGGTASPHIAPAHAASLALDLSAADAIRDASVPQEIRPLFVPPALEELRGPTTPAVTAPEAPASTPDSLAAPVAPVAAQPVPQPAPAPQPAPQASQPAADPPPAPAPASGGKPNFYVPAVPGGPATALEAQLLAGINAERANAGLAPYAYDSGLTIIARTRSRQMVDQGYFNHVDPYGYAMYTELLAHFGYGYAWAGENLAMNNYAAGESAARAVVSLMNSPTHRANLLGGDFSRIGIGEVTTPEGRHYYTMIFLG